MKIYSKNLRNIQDLEREKRLLLKERKRINKDDIFSLEGLLSSGEKKEDSDGAGSLMGNFAPVLSEMSGPVIGIVTDIIQQRFGGAKDSNGEQSILKSVFNKSIKKGGNILGSAAKELIFGYLKWKAIELSYKGVKLVISHKKKKKAEKEQRQSDI